MTDKVECPVCEATKRELVRIFGTDDLRQLDVLASMWKVRNKVEETNRQPDISHSVHNAPLSKTEKLIAGSLEGVKPYDLDGDCIEAQIIVNDALVKIRELGFGVVANGTIYGSGVLLDSLEVRRFRDRLRQKSHD